jgi:hypothetical protein
MEAVKHKCKYGCGFERDHRGAVNVHEAMHCKLKQGGTDAEMKKVESKKAPKVYECECGEDQELQFLSKQDPRFREAIAQGYKKICVVCLEVFK